MSLKDAIEFSQKDTRNYAKRQITWFNNQPINPIYMKFENVENFIFDKLLID